MLNKKIKFSTQLKVPQIIEKLENITTGKNLIGQKKIGPYYIGKYDNSGFRFIRARPIGDCIFSSKFIEKESKTDIVVSIKTRAAALVIYICLIGLMSIVLLENNIKYDFIKITTLTIIFLVPILLAYISFRSDVKRAKSFLMDFFQKEESSLL